MRSISLASRRKPSKAAAQTNAFIASAESCTAGKLAALLSEAPGAADCLQGRFVTYTKANKTKSLGVSAGLLRAVWREVAIAMAAGALVRSPALGSGRGITSLRRSACVYLGAR
jgi:nicotinamide mononucleotide (NMN) deamidase PncC